MYKETDDTKLKNYGEYDHTVSRNMQNKYENFNVTENGFFNTRNLGLVGNLKCLSNLIWY